MPMPDSQQRLNSLTTGDATVITASGDPALADRAGDQGLETYEYADSVGGSFWMLNTDAPPFDDVRARRILARAMNHSATNDVVYEGRGDVVDHLIREPSPFFDEDTSLPSYDPESVEDLLEEYVADTGGPLEFTFLVAPGRDGFAESAQAQLTEFDDIDVHIDTLDPAQFVPTLGPGDLQAASFSLGGLDPEPDLFDHYRSSGSSNYGQYSDPELDAALETSRTSRDEAERADAYRTVQEIVARDVPDIWVTANVYPFAMQHTLHDFTTSTTYPLWDRMWVTQ